MSFICGLSTMATLIDPPLLPELVDPDEELLSDPPQPAATAATTASSAVADTRALIPLISTLLLALPTEGKRIPSANALTYNVGLCGLSRPNRQLRNQPHACRVASSVFRFAPWMDLRSG